MIKLKVTEPAHRQTAIVMKAIGKIIKEKATEPTHGQTAVVT